MKYFLIAGEASGDLHASNLVKGLKMKDPAAEFRFIGGDLTSHETGNDPIRHFREMNFMGLFAVLFNFRKLSRIFRETRRSIVAFQPDVVILVDYAGFNLRIAKFVSGKDIKVFYYISPKVWAWNSARVKKLRAYVDKLFVIFPFEVDYFRKQDMEVEFHGNPLVDAIERFKASPVDAVAFHRENKLSSQPIIALLAGSRKQEIIKCLPEMVGASKAFPEYQFVVAGAPSVDTELYNELLEGTGIKIVFDQTYKLLSVARAAVVTSGTATLETALLDVPQVVIYKTGELTYRIGKLFVNFKFFSLVNLVHQDELVTELLQSDLATHIKLELEKILNDRDHELKIRNGYAAIRGQLGEPGVSSRVAARMVELMNGDR